MALLPAASILLFSFLLPFLPILLYLMPKSTTTPGGVKTDTVFTHLGAQTSPQVFAAFTPFLQIFPLLKKVFFVSTMSHTL